LCGFGARETMNPATVRASRLIGHEHDFGLAVAIEIVTGVVLIEDHPKAGGSEDTFARRIVDRRSAIIASAACRIARGAQRDLISIPQLLLV
jgi:hypothetical protein